MSTNKKVAGKAFAELTKRTASAFARKEIDDVDVKKDYAQEVIDAKKAGDNKRALEAGAKRAVKIAENPKEYARYIYPEKKAAEPQNKPVEVAPTKTTKTLPEFKNGVLPIVKKENVRNDISSPSLSASGKTGGGSYSSGGRMLGEGVSREATRELETATKKYNKALGFHSEEIEDIVNYYLQTGKRANTGNKKNDDAINKLIDLRIEKDKAGVKYALEKQKEDDVYNQYYRNQYGIDTSNFNVEDLIKWGKEHNFTYYLPTEPTATIGTLKANTTGEKPTEQEKEDAKRLSVIANQNQISTDIANSKAAAYVYNAGNIISTPVRSAKGGLFAVKSGLDKMSGKDVDVYDDLVMPQYASDAIKKATQENYTSKWFGGREGALLGNYGNFLYGAGTSALENTVNILFSQGVVKGLGLEGNTANKVISNMTSAIMGSDVAANTIVHSIQNGESDGKALLKGYAAGFIEWLTEKYSIETILKGGTTLWGTATKSFLAESSEELTSNWLNRAVDRLINPATNDVSMMYYTYLSKGNSPKAALEKVALNVLSDDFQSAIAGGLAGIAMGGAFRGTQSVQDMRAGKYIAKKGAVNSLISQALNMGENTESNITAQRMAQEITEGKTPSNKALGELLRTFTEEGGKFQMPDETQMRKEKGNNEKKYKIAYTTDNTPIAVIEDDILAGVDKSEWIDKVKETIKDKFSGGIPIKGRLIKVNKITRNEFTNSNSSNFYDRTDRTVYEDKFKSANNLDDIVLASTNYVNEDLKHTRKDNFKEFARGDVLIKVGENDYKAKVVVGFTTGNEMVLYDVIDFTPTNIDLKKMPSRTDQQNEVSSHRTTSSNSNQQTEDVQAPSSNAQDASADNGVSNTTVTQNESGVNTYNMQNSLKNTGIVQSEVSERFRQVRPKFHTVLDGVGKRLGVSVVIDEEIENADGYFDPKTSEIHISANAQNPLREVIKHEITHVLEGTKEYDDLVSFMKENFSNEWNDTESRIRGLYERINKVREISGKELLNKTPEDIAHETMADFAEQFKSDEFLERVANENPSMITKIKNFISDIIARFKGVFSSQELKRWQEAEKMWENAFNNADVTKRSGEREYKIITLDDGKKYVKANEQVIKSKNADEWENEIIEYVNKVVRKGEDFVIPMDNEENIVITEKTAWKLGDKGEYDDKVYFVKGNASGVIDEIIQVSKYNKSKPPLKVHPDGFAKYGFDYRTAYFEDLDGKYYRLRISVGVNADDKVAYNIGNIKNIGETPSKGLKGPEGASPIDNGRISQNEAVVNTYNTQNSKKDTQKEFKLQEPIDIDAEYGSYVAAVEAENAEIKEVNESLKREITSERTLSTNPGRVNEVVTRIRKDYKSTVNLKETAGKVQEIWEKMVSLSGKSENVFRRQYEKLFYELTKIGEEIAENTTEVDRTMYDQYKSLRDRIRNTAIAISDSDASSIPDFNAFKRSNFGRMKITKNTTFGVDSFYQELCEDYPEFFPTEITHPADQLIKISEVLDFLKPKVLIESQQEFKNMYGIDFDDAGSAIAAEIVNTLSQSSPQDAQTTTEYLKKSFVKAYKDKYDGLKTEYNKRVEEFREQKKEREDRERLLSLAKYFQTLRTTPENLEKIPDIVKELDTMGISILEQGTKDENGNVTRYGKLELKELREQYIASLAANGETNKYIEAKIGRLDRKQIGDMEISDVRDLITTLRAVKTQIQNENKLIRDEKRREVYTAAQDVIKEVRAVRDNKNAPKGTFYSSLMLSPQRMARRMVNYAKNSTFVELADKINEGNHKRMEFLQQTALKFSEISKEGEKLEKVSGKNAEVKTYRIGNNEFSITPAMRIALYLHSQCEDNMRHITKGGIVIPNAELYNKGDIKNAFSESKGAVTAKFTKQDIDYITRDMTTFEKKIAETVNEWLNDDCKKALNETSLQLLGYEVARMNRYFPIKTSDNFTKSDSLIVDGTLEGQGMLKERQGAVNPIKLIDVMKVIEMQQEGVAKYYGLAIPLRNFKAVLNSNTIGMEDSVKAAIDSVWGVKYNNYIDDMLADLQSSRQNDDDLSRALRKYRGNYAQAVLSLNLPVTIKQAASYPTAAAVVGWKPLLEALKSPMTEADKAAMNKYSPLIWYRSQGYSMQEIGDFAAGKDGLSKRLPMIMGTIQAVDVATTTKLWKAAEIYVENQKRFEKGSDAFYKEVAKVHNEIIEETQPNYEVMQRPGILRNPNEVARSFAMFATQRFQNYNILADSIGELRAAEASGVTEEMVNNKVIENADKKWIDAFKEAEKNKVIKQIDTWDKNGRNPRVFFNFGQPSNLLKHYGISGAYIQLDASKVLKILDEHPEMDLDVIKQLENIISDPVLLLKSKAQNVGKSFVLYGEVMGKNGNPVMVSIRTNMTGGVNSIQDVSKITSAYTRRNTQNFINTSDVLWVTPDKKRASKWMYSFGLQLPSATSNANSFTNTTISQDKEGVNRYSIQKLKNNEEFVKFVRQNFKEEWNKKRAEAIKSCKAENEEWIKEARGNAYDAVTSQIVSNIVLSAMNFAGALVLKRATKWKDEDEDEFTKGSVARGFVDDALSSFAGMFLGGSELYQIIKAGMGKDKWYDLTMPATDIINGVIGQTIEFSKIINDSDRRFHIKEYIKPTTRFAESAFQALGIPAANAGKLVNMVYEHTLDALSKFGVEEYSARYWKFKITTPEREKAKYGKFLKTVGEKALSETDPKKRERLLSQWEYISDDMKRYMDEDYITDKQKAAFKGYVSSAIAEGDFEKVNGLNKEMVRFIGAKEADNVKKGAIKTASATNSAEKWAEEFEKTKPEEVYEGDRDKDGTRYITYDGEKHKLTVEQEITYLKKIDDYTGDLYDSIIGNNQDISEVLYGKEKHTDKTTKTEEKRVYDYFYRQFEKGKITEAQLDSNYNKYLKGEIEVPILKAYVQGQELTYSQLTYSQRKEVISAEEKKVKKGELTQAEFESWKKDFESGEATVSKSLQIIEPYYDLDRETQHKVLGKIKSSAEKKAQADMRKEVMGE